MSTLNRIADDLARVVDRLSTKIEKKTLPSTAADLDAQDLSEVEALALALFAEGRPGSDIEKPGRKSRARPG